MSEESESSPKLNIRCPACRQRFHVTPDLMNRMVECGECDTRFRINDEVIVRAKKFYPGERADPKLKRFQRVPISAAPPPAGLQQVQYQDFNSPEQLGPISPQRVVAGIFGVSIMVIVAIPLLFMSGPGSGLNVMPVENKLIIAGFVSFLGLILLIYANPRARFKATLVGLALSAGLISIPLFLNKEPPNIATNDDNPNENVLPIIPVETVDPQAALRERFTTGPLEKEQGRLDGIETNQKAFGVYITEMVGRNKYTVRDFLIRDTGAALSSHLYPRDNDNYLMVLTGVSKSINEVAEIAGKLGKTEEIHPQIGIVVVSVDNRQFIAGSAAKLNDKTDPAFYDLNLRELKNIDLDRVRKAVERLADAKSSIYRTDITKIMLELMLKPGVTFHDSLSKALLVWAEDPVPAAEVGLQVIKNLLAKGLPVPEELVALVAAGKDPEAIPTLIAIWKEKPVIWDKYLIEFGSAAEPAILENVNADSAPLKRSALSILAQIGTSASLPALKEILEDGNPELKVLAERAITSIEQP
ncbi:MAG: hypothetical protein AB8D78_12435 [Akkermansiaceae bacterium]